MAVTSRAAHRRMLLARFQTMPFEAHAGCEALPAKPSRSARRSSARCSCRFGMSYIATRSCAALAMTRQQGNETGKCNWSLSLKSKSGEIHWPGGQGRSGGVHPLPPRGPCPMGQRIAPRSSRQRYCKCGHQNTDQKFAVPSPDNAAQTCLWLPPTQIPHQQGQARCPDISHGSQRTDGWPAGRYHTPPCERRQGRRNSTMAQRLFCQCGCLVQQQA